MEKIRCKECGKILKHNEVILEWWAPEHTCARCGMIGSLTVVFTPKQIAEAKRQVKQTAKEFLSE